MSEVVAIYIVRNVVTMLTTRSEIQYVFSSEDRVLMSFNYLKTNN